MQKTLGGDRLGSGQKSKVNMKNYNRSTHDLSQTTTTPMTPGVLYPTLILPALRGDKFTIKTSADVVTIPTTGPLFGSFKMQTDFFQCDVRLYQALLHNNPLALGLKVQQVMLPAWRMMVTGQLNKMAGEFNKSCLWSYLGMKGIGRLTEDTINGNGISGERTMNAVPMLAYYDIFKTYYANKQEKDAYVITPNENNRSMMTFANAEGFLNSTPPKYWNVDEKEWGNIYGFTTFKIKYENNTTGEDATLENYLNLTIAVRTKEEPQQTYNIKISELIKQNEFIKDRQGFEYFVSENGVFVMDATKNLYCILQINGKDIGEIYLPQEQTVNTNALEQIQIQKFPLVNLDNMRMNILSFHQLGVPFRVESQNYLPYSANKFENSKYPLNGLVLKTYQSDIYNNWINTEYIDGENGIAAITAIQPEEDGSIKIDEVLLKERLYNLMNRIATGGTTYDDYLDVAYEPTNRRAIEAPIYLGGMSSEIVFEQIVQTAPADGNPLGTLGGRGRHVKRKGGNITVKVDQPAFIIAITSLTPRINYCQGNEFYMTDLQSIFDFHKPEMDGIGFQNLVGERLAWFDTITRINEPNNVTRSVVGKIPAWLEYMTAVNKTYGDFAQGDKSFMVLNRNYEQDEDGGIADATTYIDPQKYNYAFAYKNLDAQNFWAQIYFDIKARRLMSAKIIPSI